MCHKFRLKLNCSDDCGDGENPPKKGEMGKSVAIKSESKAHLQQFPKKFWKSSEQKFWKKYLKKMGRSAAIKSESKANLQQNLQVTQFESRLNDWVWCFCGGLVNCPTKWYLSCTSGGDM